MTTTAHLFALPRLLPERFYGLIPGWPKPEAAVAVAADLTAPMSA